MYVDNNSWQILRVLEFVAIKLELYRYPVWHVASSILEKVGKESPEYISLRFLQGIHFVHMPQFTHCVTVGASEGNYR